MGTTWASLGESQRARIRAMLPGLAAPVPSREYLFVWDLQPLRTREDVLRALTADLEEAWGSVDVKDVEAYVSHYLSDMRGARRRSSRYTDEMRNRDDVAEELQRARLAESAAVAAMQGDDEEMIGNDHCPAEEASLSTQVPPARAPLATLQQVRQPHDIAPAPITPAAGALVMVADGARAAPAGRQDDFSWGSNALAKECAFWREVGRLGDHVTAEGVCTGVLSDELASVRRRLASLAASGRL